MSDQELVDKSSQGKETALLFGTFIIAICGLVYELIAGTLSSYLLGDSVFHFSLVIGLFMSSMGIGAWLSRFIIDKLERAFVLLQFGIALLGGFSAFILFYAFAYLDNYDAFLYVVTICLGTMLGIEIPLIIRILQRSFSLKDNVSNVFTLDYIGALFASLLFPLVLVPQLGLMQSSFLFGGMNLIVGTMGWYIFREKLGGKYLLAIAFVFMLLIAGFIYSNKLTSFIDNKLYQDKIVLTQQTSYQKIVITSMQGRLKFYINGALQFDVQDEYRYHESLVHPVMQHAQRVDNILIIGGGDGMALREVLKYGSIKSVTLVDLDPAITGLFKSNKELRELNQESLNSDKVQIVNDDAWKFLEHSKAIYDVIIIDLPDPNNISLSRLYSTTFYTLASAHLAQAGMMVTQASSPMYTTEAYWCIDKSMREAELNTVPYHAYVPSFGEWGFVMSSRMPINIDRIYSDLPSNLKYYSQETMKEMMKFPADIDKIEVEANRLSSHPLVRYYNDGWKKWYGR